MAVTGVWSSPETSGAQSSGNAASSVADLIRSDLSALEIYKRFIGRYVGDLHLPIFPSIEREHPQSGNCSYSEVLEPYCFTASGLLVHIRRSMEAYKQVPVSGYFIVVASLGKLSGPCESEVLDLVNRGRGEGLTTEIVLRHGPDTSSLVLSGQDFHFYPNQGQGELLLPGETLTRQLGIQ